MSARLTLTKDRHAFMLGFTSPERGCFQKHEDFKVKFINLQRRNQERLIREFINVNALDVANASKNPLPLSIPAGAE